MESKYNAERLASMILNVLQSGQGQRVYDSNYHVTYVIDRLDKLCSTVAVLSIVDEYDQILTSLYVDSKLNNETRHYSSCSERIVDILESVRVELGNLNDSGASDESYNLYCLTIAPPTEQDSVEYRSDYEEVLSKIPFIRRARNSSDLLASTSKELEIFTRKKDAMTLKSRRVIRLPNNVSIRDLSKVETNDNLVYYRLSKDLEVKEVSVNLLDFLRIK